LVSALKALDAVIDPFVERLVELAADIEDHGGLEVLRVERGGVGQQHRREDGEHPAERRNHGRLLGRRKLGP